ncbi:WD40/YVTN/BNR-like repeat-containing protein [Dokdonia sp. Hel_I_53]|uniref:WD40/YVTN/BNR-like repeat-containing protein n=1 Tax=Dokdonia sp. Hel_I_53 TaxID=1566287 RepID=UPI001198DFE1|nr:oxidoreductase [Dokdonia sp. Hel_I_53]TVZ51444.1 hypothetical protein OD90_0587 [Dokdonia sp. Hel_I_53]
MIISICKGIGSPTDSSIFTKILMVRRTYIIYLILIAFISCKANQKERLIFKKNQRKYFTSVTSKKLQIDSTSIRALEIYDNYIAYAGSNGHYGVLIFDYIQSENNVNSIVISDRYDSSVTSLGINPSFRSLAITDSKVFFLSIGSPALLYSYNISTKKIDQVYEDLDQRNFYDSMSFWNSQEGIAIGDPIENCLSILITRDGGNSWDKISCNNFPNSLEGEAAFAASDTNIKVIGNKTWIVSGGGASRIFYSPDKGITWEVYSTPLLQGKSTQGAYTMDFYNDKSGIIYGGDYTMPFQNISNIASTIDGGKTWHLRASGSNDGYKSCVQYVPNSNGNEIVAMGFTGITYSSNGGNSWTKLSNEAFLSFRFINDTTAIASGTNKLAFLEFK